VNTHSLKMHDNWLRQFGLEILLTFLLVFGSGSFRLSGSVWAQVHQAKGQATDNSQSTNALKPQEPHGVWSKKVWADNGQEICVIYQAAIFKNALVIRFQHQSPWHTYALDNHVRAKMALAGKKSLGSEESTKVTVEGVVPSGSWFQTRPTNFSKPKLRWFSWGFQREGFFALKFDTVNAKSLHQNPKSKMHLHITGQACSQGTCIPVDVKVALTKKNFIDKDFDFHSMELSRNHAEKPSSAQKSKVAKDSPKTATEKPSFEGRWQDLSTKFAADLVQRIWPTFRGYSGEKGISLQRILPDLKEVGFGATDKNLVFSSYVAKGSAELLSQMDPNRDGWITKEEMQDCVEKQIYERMDYRILQDVNNDGKVSPKEYSVSLRPGKQKVDQSGLTKRARSSFNRQDVNKNGFIDLNSEVFPNLSRDAGSQVTRFCLALRISRLIGPKGWGEKVSETQFQKLFTGKDPIVVSKIWKGLQDMGRFGRRGRKPQKNKVYKSEITIKSIAYRIATLSSEVLILLEENL